MKTTGFIATTVAILSMSAMASDCATTATHSHTAKASQPCVTPTMTQAGTVQGCGQEWADIETVTLEAANGDPIAQFIIAYLTENDPSMSANKSMAKDMYTKAIPGLKKAAANGDKKACRALAHIYGKGCGVAQDPAKAKEYMKQCGQCCGSSACPTDGCMKPGQ